ncbi:MAG: hypothetical protein ACYC4D_09530 [Thermoleophilia bacterium]
MKKAVIATIIFLLVLASPVLVNAASGKLGSPEEAPDLTKGTDSDAEVCVAPVGGDREETKDYMRINHQQQLKEERVKVVREGKRDERLQIERCFSCHKYEDFCKECHSYNGVQPGCMDQTNGCHSTEDQPRWFRPEGYKD